MNKANPCKYCHTKPYFMSHEAWSGSRYALTCPKCKGVYGYTSSLEGAVTVWNKRNFI